MEKKFVKYTEGYDVSYLTKNKPYEVLPTDREHRYKIINDDGRENIIVVGGYCAHIGCHGWTFCDENGEST